MRAVRAPAAALVAASLLLAAAGCASKGVSLRSVPRNPLSDSLKLSSYWGPEPTPRTMQVLRVSHLDGKLDGPRRELLDGLQAAIDREPSADKVYAFAELAYLGGKEAEEDDPALAVDLYGASVLYAYHYLFDDFLANVRNPYDPQFRGACDLYNAALEGALRLVCDSGELVPGRTRTICTAVGNWDINCVLCSSNWRPEDIDHFKFASDYEIKGLKNHYRRHGLGVPLIAVRKPYANEPALAKYYPPDLSFPVTAFVRPSPHPGPSADGQAMHHQASLELYDPLTTPDIAVAHRYVPLESDLTTPLAYFLSKPELDTLAWIGLLSPDLLLRMRPDRPDPISGIYMAQPYEPGKIPVVMVHGLWSTPMTWIEMFNDLRSSPEIREKYQFWFYLYPTGQPFWLSAAQLRRDLAEIRQVLDPHWQQPALGRMVLVGHSMGGLVSRLQTFDSGIDYWALASEKPFQEVQAEPEVQQRLADTFFFRPDPTVRRVVTLGTPHRGSDFSNQTTQWLLGKLITYPQRLLTRRERLFLDNEGFFDDDSLLRVDTSIDSLSPESPIFPAMLASRRPGDVRYHNIVGVIPDDKWWLSLFSGGDGVVEEESARMTDVVSEVTVPADHTGVHSHPLAVNEVRRILLQHLHELQAPAPVANAALPWPTHGPQPAVNPAGGHYLR